MPANYDGYSSDPDYVDQPTSLEWAAAAIVVILAVIVILMTVTIVVF
jgi:hypothetical protein